MNLLPRLTQSLLVILVLASGGYAASPAVEQPVFPTPPRLATSAEELAAAKSAPDFPAVRSRAVTEADPLLQNPVPLPDGAASWIFYYACPDDGTRLIALNPEQHQCPKCKKIYSDERTIAAYRFILHNQCEEAVLKLGWAYAYTGEDKYARGVQRVLLKFADDYQTYPGRLDRWGHTGFFAPLGGRRYVQSLDEAYGVINLAKAYDLCRNSPAWSDAQRKHVEVDFFRATAASLLRFNQDINNHQTWYNAGLMAIASVLGDPEMVRRVLHMQGGFFDQLEHSVNEDGLWYEGSIAYHNYALLAMTEIVDATRRLGLTVYQNDKLRRMITGPLHAAYPDGSFPVINDSDPANIATLGWAFRWGWKTYHDPLMAQAAARGDVVKLRAMLGPDAKVQWPLDLQSEALTGAGLAILREGEGSRATCVVMDYGPHGGGHGHFDKLNICLFANGREWLLDPGRLTYSHKEYLTWAKTTAAHNTVTLDGRNQAATTGKLRWLKSGDGWSACCAESDAAYPGTMLRRYLLLTPDFLVDVFDVDTIWATQIDWLAHATADSVKPGQPMTSSEPVTLGANDGYQHFTNTIRWGPAAGVKSWNFTADKLVMTAQAVSPPAEQVFTTLGIGYKVEQKTPTLVRRVNARQVRFITVFDLSGAGEKRVQDVSGETDPAKPSTVKLQFNPASGGTKAWQIGLTPDDVVCQVSK